MKKKLSLSILLLLVFTLAFTMMACSSDQGEEVEDVAKEGAEEVVDDLAGLTEESIIEFADEGFESVVRFYLKNDDQDISLGDLDGIKSIVLNAKRNGVESLEDLKYLRNLEGFVASGFELDNLETILKKDKLTSIYIDGGLKEVPKKLAWNLREATFKDGDYGDLSFLKGQDLEYLEISGTAISSLDFVKGMENLEILYADENNISDLSPLKGLSKLDSLTLDKNKVTDLSPLAGLENLSYIRLEFNEGLEDLSPIMDLPLTRLAVYGFEGDEGQIKALEDKGVDVDY